MPYRTFSDSTGTDWQVWDIVPQLTERRGAKENERERRVDIIPIAFADRRREARRLVETHRAVLRGSYAQGWLCFQSDRGKRRLTPIPNDWTVCGDDRLEAYSRRAERVSGATKQIMDSNAEPPMEEAG